MDIFLYKIKLIDSNIESLFLFCDELSKSQACFATALIINISKFLYETKVSLSKEIIKHVKKS